LISHGRAQSPVTTADRPLPTGIFVRAPCGCSQPRRSGVDTNGDSIDDDSKPKTVSRRDGHENRRSRAEPRPCLRSRLVGASVHRRRDVQLRGPFPPQSHTADVSSTGGTPCLRSPSAVAGVLPPNAQDVDSERSPRPDWARHNGDEGESDVADERPRVRRTGRIAVVRRPAGDTGREQAVFRGSCRTDRARTR
jgi:hypothetical protein